MSSPSPSDSPLLGEATRRLAVLELEQAQSSSGRRVSCHEPVSGPSTPPRRRTPTIQLVHLDDQDLPDRRHQTLAAGTSSSPISVSSSSSPETRLPRPRGKAQYMTREARTAYTPPRPRAKQWSTPSTSPSNTTVAKPVHPFFHRHFKRSKSSPAPAPPASQQPRMVAHYSSTSESPSEQSSRTSSQSSLSSQSSQMSQRGSRTVLRRTSVQVVTCHDENPSSRSGYASSEAEETVEEPRAHRSTAVDEVAAMMADLEFRPFGLPDRQSLYNPTTLPTKHVEKKEHAQASIKVNRLPTVVSSVPSTAAPTGNSSLFHYRDVTPRPKIAYTSDLDEAEDLLSCLKGDILGFDLEWPIAGTKDVDGRLIGMKRDPQTGRIAWEQGKTALMQICDEDLVVLVQVWDMPRLPRKAIELLQDKSKYKLGVQIRGDGLKLLRDYPNTFPDGIVSLLELSYLARKADPLGTGPGNTLISLAKLVKAYTGQELGKDLRVRAGNWTANLDQSQIDYAANDVVSAIQVFKRLVTLSRESNVDLNLREFCLDVGITSPPSKPSPIMGPAGSIARPEGASRPTPSELRAINLFKDGMTTEAIAGASGIKIGTVHSYICKALMVLPRDVLELKDQQRFVSEVPEGSYVHSAHKSLFRTLSAQSDEERANEAHENVKESKHLVSESEDESESNRLL